MPGFWEKFGTQIKEFLGGWPSLIAVGTFLLYLLGYLSTRFYLTVLGVGTDLAVLDERYVFAGAKFIVYLVSTIPILVMVGLGVAGLHWLLKRLFGKKKQPGQAPPKSWIKRFFADGTKVAVLDMFIAVALIQLVMRKCFFFFNLLLAKDLPDPGFGLEELLLDESDTTRYMFFTFLVGGTIVTVALWFRARRAQKPARRPVLALLAVLIVIQFLLLPVNYGVYIQDRFLPRVAELGDQVPLPAGQKAWLVWEGTSTFTYLVQDGMPITAPSPTPTPTPVSSPSPTPRNCRRARTTPSAVSTRTPVASPAATPEPSPTPAVALTSQPAPFGRRLISVPQKNLKQTTILKYDQIIKHIFRPQ